MALATKCPQCGALFRVVADQLKLRGGLVRCGQCRAVFDAIGSLTYVDDSVIAVPRTTGAEGEPPAPAPTAEPAAAPATEDGRVPRGALGPSTTFRIAPVPPATIAGTLPGRFEPRHAPSTDEPAVIRRRGRPTRAADAGDDGRDGPAGRDEELGVPTLAAARADDGAYRAVRPAADEARGAEGVDETAAADTVVAPALGTAVDDGHEEAPPSFARPQRRRLRGFSIVYGGGSALLVLLAVVQCAVIFRGPLMMHWPQARPLLTQLCGVFDCAVSWPTQPDLLAVIGTELQAIPGTDALELSAVIRNRAEFRQALPSVEVTLTDARNRALARKVFSPVDYLGSAGEPTARLQEGLAPGGDLTIRIFFEARGLSPAGFLVYPFYL